jgi:ParB-like chromosome segregation protein Spo0J
MPLSIRDELQSLIPPLSAEEYVQLEQNLLTDGCLNPLIVWQEEQILLDGHHRYEICTRHGLDYQLREMSLPDLDAAKAWLISHQLGRRNLTPDQMAYYRGEQYNLQKHRHGGNRKSDGSSTQNGNLKTVDRLAAEHGVSKNTIARDAVYAKAIDTLAEVVGPEARHTLLARDTKVSQQDVKALAKMAPYAAKEALAAVRAVKTPKQARKIVREATRQRREHEAYMDAIARSNCPEEDWPASLRPKPTPTPADGLAPRLRQTLHSLEVLHTCLQMVSLPDDLAPHREACLALGKAYRQIEQLMQVVEAQAPSPQLSLADAPVAPAPDAALPAPPEPDCPPYNAAVWCLGKLCPKQHAWGSTGQSLLHRTGKYCRECSNETKRAKTREKQTQAVDAP